MMRRTATFSLGLMSVLAVVLSLAPKSAFAAKCNWTVTGKLAVKHKLLELKDKFNGRSLLRGVLVNVSARKKVGALWTPWGSWGSVRTSRSGKFLISKRKSCGKRKFRVRVKFKDSSLEVRHKKSHPANWVKWHTVIKNRPRRAGGGRISYGQLTFKPGGKRALGNDFARAQADIWVLYKMAIRHVRRMGKGYRFKGKVKVKYPHKGPVKDDIESSYADPLTKEIWIIKNSKKDQFFTNYLLHELGHVWAYNHSSGENCLTQELLKPPHTTHGLVKDHCAAFHEGFAEYWMEKMRQALFGKRAPLPVSRKWVASQGLTTLRRVQRHDWGWNSVFRMLTTPNIHKYDFGTALTGAKGYVVAKSSAPKGCTSPKITFKNVLRAFNPRSSKGYPKQLARKETTISKFLNRSAAILGPMTRRHGRMYKKLADPSKTSQPSDSLCRS
jgi:hypothetical protein